MRQLTVSLQAGGQAYSKIVFFQDERAFEEFASGRFEFGARGMALFTVVKGGLMYEASVGGAKFEYQPL